MSAFRQAVLSVAPERLEQFTLEMKKNISDKPVKKRKESHSRDKSSSRPSHSKKRRKSSDHRQKTKKNRSTGSSGKEAMDKTTQSKSRDEKSSKSRDEKSSSSKDNSRKHTSTSKKRMKRGRHAKTMVKDDSDIDPKDLDLSVPLLPLIDLVKNRTQLLDAVFTIIKGPKLTSMLPDILKLMPLDEIKRLCHEQLDGMSSKRVVHILSGTSMDSSSGTDSSDGEDPKEHSPKHQCASQDHSLQANFIDSTTEEPSGTSKSMLFPSALSTAHSKISSAEIPLKEVPNDNASEHDTVSTSTEPNFIYSAETESVASEPEESEESSDPEDGEVHSSEDEHTEKIKVSEAAARRSVDEEVFVEEVEVEEYDEESSKADLASVPDHRGKVTAKTSPESTNKAQDNRQETCSKQNRQADCLPSVQETQVKKQTGAPNSKERHEEDEHLAAARDGSSSSGSAGTNSGKSQLEILELELRARAIRSLMNAAKSGKLKPVAK